MCSLLMIKHDQRILTNFYTPQMKIESISKEKEESAELMLRTQFEMESIVYTQDTTYSKKLGKRKREEEQAPELSFGAIKIPNINERGATLKEMVKHLKSYYQVSIPYVTRILINVAHI